jgi:GAF domain-containing protein
LEALKLPEKIKDYALKNVLSEILEEIQDLSGFQCVGIRLQSEGDYPYYVQEGFPSFFVLKENSLCSRDKEGKPLVDEEENFLLDCMCGNVIKGRFDPKRPYFTERGSFWTNSTTQLLDDVSEDGLGRTRNMCHHSGYESVALIPLRVGDKTFGLIQMDDPRENMFTPEMIEKFESLADRVGAVVFNALEIQEGMANFFDLVNKFKHAKK